MNTSPVEFKDIDGHLVVPGAWLHYLSLRNLTAAQVTKYGPVGPNWCCWVRHPDGLEEAVTELTCLSSSVRLDTPLHERTIEWVYLERRLMGKIGLPPVRRLASWLIEHLGDAGADVGNHGSSLGCFSADKLATLLLCAAYDAGVTIEEA
jgi:hypothetical protein